MTRLVPGPSHFSACILSSVVGFVISAPRPPVPIGIAAGGAARDGTGAHKFGAGDTRDRLCALLIGSWYSSMHAARGVGRRGRGMVSSCKLAIISAIAIGSAALRWERKWSEDCAMPLAGGGACFCHLLCSDQGGEFAMFFWVGMQVIFLLQFPRLWRPWPDRTSRFWPRWGQFTSVCALHSPSESRLAPVQPSCSSGASAARSRRGLRRQMCRTQCTCSMLLWAEGTGVKNLRMWKVVMAQSASRLSFASLCTALGPVIGAPSLCQRDCRRLPLPRRRARISARRWALARAC